MAKLKITDDWWTSPTQGVNGGLVMVTGRANVKDFIESGKFNERVEITWKYTPEENGMPDLATSKLMEGVTDALNATFEADPVAIMTGIYTGEGERNWIFYTRSLPIFERKLNESLASFDVLPISIYVEKDPDWDEYKEMKEQSEIIEGD